MSTDAAAPAVDNGNKVYVGKVGANSTKESLTAAFTRAGPVVDVSLHVGRGRSHAKYAYVTFNDKAHAEKAVAELNNAKVDDAELLVELPRPRTDRPPREPRKPREPREPRPPREPREPSADGATGSDRPPRNRRRTPRPDGEEVAASTTAATATPVDRPRRAPRARPAPTEGGETAAAAPAVAGDARPARGGARGGRRGGRGGRPPRPVSGEEGTAAPRAARAPRPRPSPEELAARPDSDSDLFVANLKYEVTDEELLELFKPQGATSAKVASFRGRSKGYGFVHFDNGDGAKKGLALDNSDFRGRTLTVRHAKVRPESPTA